MFVSYFSTADKSEVKTVRSIDNKEESECDDMTKHNK